MPSDYANRCVIVAVFYKTRKSSSTFVNHCGIVALKPENTGDSCMYLSVLNAFLAKQHV